MEHGQGEGLALCVRAQVGLEAERVDGRDEGLDGVERRAGDGGVLGHVTSEGRQTEEVKSGTSAPLKLLCGDVVRESCQDVKLSLSRIMCEHRVRPTSSEPGPCRLQTRSQREPAPPQSNMAPSTLAWPEENTKKHSENEDRSLRGRRARADPVDL